MEYFFSAEPAKWAQQKGDLTVIQAVVGGNQNEVEPRQWVDPEVPSAVIIGPTDTAK